MCLCAKTQPQLVTRSLPPDENRNKGQGHESGMQIGLEGSVIEKWRPAVLLLVDWSRPTTLPDL